MQRAQQGLSPAAYLLLEIPDSVVVRVSQEVPDRRPVILYVHLEVIH